MPAVFARQIALLSTVAIVIVAAVVVPARSPLPWVIYNVSGSAPLGWYRVVRRTPARGELAVVRPLEAVESALAMATHHAPNVPLLKRVAGVEGDQVCRVGTVVFVDGEAVAEALERHQNGHPPPVWEGCVTLRRGQFFLLNDHRYSFDSRYFGPVDERQVLGVARPIWTWNRAD